MKLLTALRAERNGRWQLGEGTGGAAMQSAGEARLHGAFLALGRALWLAVMAASLVALAAGFPALRAGLGATVPPGGGDLGRIGVSVQAYMAASVFFAVIFVGTYLAVAILIFVKRSDEPIALGVSLFLVAFAASTPLSGLAPAGAPPLVGILATVLSLFSWIPLNAFFYLFPNGRFVPHWTWAPLLVVVIIILSSLLPANFPLSANAWPDWLMGIIYACNWGIAVGAQVYRYRRASSPIERQQTKWVVYGFVASTVLTTLFSLPGTIWPALGQPGSLYSLGQEPVNALLKTLIPLSLGVAVMRYRLWDIDPVINRTLLYAALTAIVVTVYIGIVGAAGLLLQAQGNLFVSVLAAGLIAVLFQPLRERLQRGVNRLMYGERDDPYAVLTRLGQRLEAALAPEMVLPAILETVVGSLKLPYAAISLRTAEGGWQRVAAYGREERRAGTDAPPGSIRLPIVYQNETIGYLALAPRSAGDTFTPADHRLLRDLAGQIGAAAHAVRLNADLQRSRERLVLAREEERRRLRRDLHDGLGPTLAALALTAGNVADLVQGDPASAEMAAKLENGIRAAIADIRRLVYELRPPTLDELGLVAAIRERAAQVSHTARGPEVAVEAPANLAALPAAVEVAAYRITEEALTNVVRHAQARHCTIRFALDDGGGCLAVEIADDGRGITGGHRAGVGLLSMRERAEELGGTCAVEPAAGGGTRVQARLPVKDEG